MRIQPIDILQIITAMPSGILWNYYIAKTVPLRRPRLYVLVTFLVLTVYYPLRNYVITEPSVFFDTIGSISCLVCAFCFAPKKKHWMAVFLGTLYLLACLIVLLLMTALSSALAEPMGLTMDQLMTGWGGIIMTLITLLPTWLVFHLVYRLILRFRIRSLNIRSVLLFLLIAGSQILLLGLMTNMMNGEGDANKARQLTPLGITVCVLADVAFVYGMSRQRQAQALRLQTEQAQRQLELQTDYYDKLQSNILAINQIRHDIVNQLQTVHFLLGKGETSQAMEQIEQIGGEVRQHVGAKYCANLVADAVLCEKAEDCAEHGITLNVTAELPPRLPIKNAYLCSVFSNILDNSIAGTLESGAAEKTISLEAGIKTGFLVLRCQNPAAARPTQSAPDNDPMRVHGLGLEILGKLASMCGGELRTTRQDGRFTTVVMLACPDSDA